MKKFILAGIVLAVATMTSCKDSRAILGGEYPYVVEKVEVYDETHSEYFCAEQASLKTKLINVPSSCEDGYVMRASIILPTGWYTVGDTILAPKPKRR